MNGKQFERYLRQQHGILSSPKPGTGHKTLINPANGMRSELPMHGGRQQLGTGLRAKILKDLGLKP